MDAPAQFAALCRKIYAAFILLRPNRSRGAPLLNCIWIAESKRLRIKAIRSPIDHATKPTLTSRSLQKHIRASPVVILGNTERERCLQLANSRSRRVERRRLVTAEIVRRRLHVRNRIFDVADGPRDTRIRRVGFHLHGLRAASQRADRG
jgi:hypothetical protein